MNRAPALVVCMGVSGCGKSTVAQAIADAFSRLGTDTRYLRRIADLGCAIALDDFGTGYSNFNYLRALPITRLKIDKSFLEDLRDPMTEKMLKLLATAAETLEVECLIEGVEDDLGLHLARRAGIGLVQGYLFSKPITAPELKEFLTVGGGLRPEAEWMRSA